MTKTISINGVNVRYKETGEGQPIVLLHGWGCSLDIFARMQKMLEHDFKVYSLDFPGFGQSDEPPVAWGMEEYTQLFESFVRELKIENPILLGHSFGGRVSIIYASRNKVHKVVLVDAAGVKPSRSLKYYLKVYSFKLYKKLLPLLVGKRKANQKIEAYRNKAGSSDYNSASPMMKKVLIKVVNEDLRHFMPKIEAPTLLLWGENDTATPVKDAQKMEKLIKGSGLVVFKGAGHYSFLDAAFQFDAVLNSFLEKDKQKK
ncbi:alpha/beta fold hydrolase [Dysgonomonas sp. 25]|uniref:alpha/beta fold hydrolase n=1 Tax=Dysgonomonas sp. 25 TaxID=2302933 RepID=UPI0013D6D9C5|nr:alpha/beta hydrolase [Dysgonomonas sp. 25]NDV69499.1 alpha/beta hydrolase [Dysgonomonas sp. 25]